MRRKNKLNIKINIGACCISSVLALRAIKTSSSRYNLQLLPLEVKKNAIPVQEPTKVLHVIQEQRSPHLSPDGGIPDDKPRYHYKVRDPQVCPQAPL